MDCSAKLKVSYWNANGIANKKMDVIYFLNRYDIDVLLVVETFLKPVHTFSIAQYKVYRVDRVVGPKGGVLILIKSNLKHQFSKTVKLAVIESIGIKIITEKGNINLTAAYYPGSNPNPAYFRQEIKRLTARNDSNFIFGDFNARHKSWNCCSTNSAVIFSLTNTSNNFVSDRCIPNYNKADWRLFKNIINRNLDVTTVNLNNIVNYTQIDDMITKINSIITIAKNVAIPKVIPGKFNIIIPDHIVTLIKLRNKYRKKWQRQRLNIYYRNTYYSLKAEIEHQMLLARNLAWSSTLESINTQQNNSNKLFKLINTFKNRQYSIPTLNVKNKILLTNEEKSNALKLQSQNSHYLTHHKISPLENKVKKAINKFFKQNHEQSLDPSELVKPKLLMQLKQNLKNNKSA
uniref:Endo/exonuclease/phosphatase domain-containing protein n=1 Tax=Anopheles epiroticus TaxID=199890 RepID=A0A182PWS2_9DIPT